MAGKKTKKKSSAKPAKKKAAAKAPAKKGAAKKAAPKKAAPKKAAAKKAAPKKAAAKKAAPKKAAAAKAKVAAPKAPKAPKQPKAPQPIDTLDAIEAMDSMAASQGDAIEVVDGADLVSEAPDAGPKASLQTEILAMARQLYGDKTDAELLALDPNDIDAMDPSMFYELLGEKYGVEADPSNDYFGGFGGPIKNLIAFVESRWDGKTRKDTPMPPGDWLEEYVHPES